MATERNGATPTDHPTRHTTLHWNAHPICRQTFRTWLIALDELPPLQEVWLDRFLQVADRRRQEHPTIHSIYLATDHAQMVQWRRDNILNMNLDESVSHKLSGRRRKIACGGLLIGQSTAGAEMATDWHLLQQAHYLIGSFQSSIFFDRRLN